MWFKKTYIQDDSFFFNAIMVNVKTKKIIDDKKSETIWFRNYTSLTSEKMVKNEQRNDAQITMIFFSIFFPPIMAHYSF